MGRLLSNISVVTMVNGGQVLLAAEKFAKA